MIKTGKVSEVNYEKGTCKVVFDDLESYQSQDLQVITRKSKKHKTWDMPDLDEEVLVVFSTTSEGETGYIIGSFYNENTAPPATDDRVKYIFEDGSFLEYNKELKQMTVECEGDIIVKTKKNLKATVQENAELTVTKDVIVKCKNANVTAEDNITASCKSLSCTAEASITLTAPAITLDGEVTTTKNVNVAIDVITAKGSVNGHKHSYTWAHDPGAGVSAPMNE